MLLCCSAIFKRAVTFIIPKVHCNTVVHFKIDNTASQLIEFAVKDAFRDAVSRKFVDICAQRQITLHRSFLCSSIIVLIGWNCL